MGETHDSLENPPEVPMFGVKHVRGRSSSCSSDLNPVLTGIADSIVTALASQVPVHPQSSGTSSNSPSKSAELRSKYMQQL